MTPDQTVAETPTPRTDEEAFWIGAGESRTQYQGCEYIRAAVSRTLERELAAANAALRDAFAPTNTDPWSAYSLWTEKHAAAIEAARGKP